MGRAYVTDRTAAMLEAAIAEALAAGVSRERVRRIQAPTRAEGPDGEIGDGVAILAPGDPMYDESDRRLAQEDWGWRNRAGAAGQASPPHAWP